MPSVFAILALLPVHQEAVDLSRVFREGEKAQVEINSHLFTETRQYGLNTFMPDDLDMLYKFTTEVKKMKADGICEMHYLRPTFTRILGETADRPPKTIVDKEKVELLLTISPINEILDYKDLSPKKSEKDKGGGFFASLLVAPAQSLDISQYIGQVYRLALFIGNLESGMDFSPKLPLDPVKPGDTWKRTVGYSPQAVGKDQKSVNQRLDYIYSYKGIVDIDGKKFHRVVGSLELDSDLVKFINEMVGENAARQMGLRGIRLKLKANIDYDLDLETRRTVRAEAVSDGSIKIEVTQVPNEPVQEVRLKGRTTYTLLSAK